MTHNSENGVRHITHPEDNIFTDLGFDDAQAAALQQASDREIALLIGMKKQVMAEIANWIKAENLKQVNAAQILQVTRPRVSDVVNQKTEKFTLDALISMASLIGKTCRLVIK